jgi:hypothetical protein
MVLRRFPNGLALCSLIVALCIILASCAFSGSPANVISKSTEESVEGLVLHAAANRAVGIVYNADPVLGTVVEVGVYELEREASKKIALLAADPEVTALVVNQQINGKREVSVFKVTTSRKLTVALDGKFVEHISAHLITIDAAPNTASTIVVTVTDQSAAVYRKGQVNFSLTGDRAYSFDAGRGGDLSATEVEIRQKTLLGIASGYYTANGTSVYRWPYNQPPTLANCASVPTQDWSTEVSGTFTKTPRGTTWCVHTGGDRYGVMVRSSTVVPFVFIYLLWKKPGDFKG